MILKLSEMQKSGGKGFYTRLNTPIHTIGKNKEPLASQLLSIRAKGGQGMDQYSAMGLNPKSPYTLFLILVLLSLSWEEDTEEHLENIRLLAVNTKNSLENIRTGFESFHTNVETFHAQLMNMRKR